MTGRENPENKVPQQQSGPENREAADKATQDNDLTTGHRDPDDGGADNAKENK